MVVCKYFQQGHCRFGANCRNEHPQSGGTTFGNNRFGALQNNTSNNNSAGGFGSNQQAVNINTALLQDELTENKGRPNWILSSYSPSGNVSASLFQSNEFSPEEIRNRFYELRSQSKANDADQEATQLWSKAARELNDAASRPANVIQFLEAAQREHPNREDFCKWDGTKTRDEFIKTMSSQPAGFGQQGNSSSNPFSKPPVSTFGQSNAPSTFGVSPLSKPGNTGQTGFGVNSSSKPAFGQPATANTFGQPAFGASGFGQGVQNSTTFGQGAAAPSFGQSAFGSRPAGGGFGQPAFGQQANPSPFAQTSQVQPQSSSTSFGQPAQPSAFGQAKFGDSPFGKPSTTFGQPAFGSSTQPTNANPFHQGSSSTSPFGQGLTQSSAASAAPDVSMDAGVPSTPAETKPALAASPFAKPFGTSASGMGPAASSTPATAVPNSNNSTTPHPLTSKRPAPQHYTQTLPGLPSETDLAKNLRSYRGRPVQYFSRDQTAGDDTVPCYARPDGKGPERIWFPEAGATPDVAALNREDKKDDLQGPKDAYTDAVVNSYKALFDTGKFEDGKIPTVPPLREWCVYDF